MEAVSPSVRGRRPPPPILPVPTLWPKDLMPPAPWRVPAFPFGDHKLTTTYLARNAIWRAARLFGLQGREVVVPAYHHGVEVQALIEAGAEIRFARVDARLQLDVEDVRAQLSPRTGAIYVIHYAGFPQPTRELRALCDARGLFLLEDCALALFSAAGQEPLGAQGDAAFFCFYKTLPLSHGGALLVRGGYDAPAPAQRPPPLRSTVSHVASSLLVSGELKLGRLGALLRRFARAALDGPRAWARRAEIPVGTQQFDLEAVDVGMSALSAGLARSVDAREVIERRRANWLRLHAALEGTGRAAWAELPEGICPLFYGLKVDSKDRALARLRARGIHAVDFWRVGHARVARGAYPEVEALRNAVVELPCHQDLGPEEIGRVASAALAAMA